MTRFLTLLLFSPIICGLSFASTSPCPGLAANAVAVNSFPAANTPPHGCDVGSTLFNDFTVTTGAANSGVTAPGAGDVFVFANGSNPEYHIVFSTPGFGPTWVVPEGPTGPSGPSGPSPTLDSVISFTAQAGEFNFFTGLDDPIFIGPNNQSGRVLTITESYCLGASTLSSCPSGQFGTLQSVQDGVNISPSSVSFAPAYNRIAVQLDITVNNLSPQSFGPAEVAAFLDVTQVNAPQSDPAGIAPEPSELTLLGSALTVLGLFGWLRAVSNPLARVT